MPDRWKVALQVTDHMLGSPGPLPPALAEAAAAHFDAEEFSELALGIGLFHGFSKMLIALGLEPDGMETTILPTPAPPDVLPDARDDLAEPLAAVLSSTPLLATMWADMAAALVSLSIVASEAGRAAQERLSGLLGAEVVLAPTGAPAAGSSEIEIEAAVAVAELFAIDVRAITAIHTAPLVERWGADAAVQLIFSLAVVDGIARVAALGDR